MSTSVKETIDVKMFTDADVMLGNAITIFNDSISNLDTQTETLLDCWDGDGKNAFKDAYTRLKTALKDETENLETIKKDLESCGQSYSDWDSAMQKSIIESQSKENTNG